MESDLISLWIEQHQRFSAKELQNFILENTELDVRKARALQTAISGKLFKRCLPSVFYIEVFITENCNLACDYCFVHGKNQHNRMSQETARQAVDFAFSEYNQSKQVSLFFMGGEPLLEFPLIKEMVHYANQKAKQFDKKLNYNMTTNGILLDEEILSFSKEHNLKLLLSLDGLPACHNAHRKTSTGEGSFNKIARKIPMMKRYQPWLGARVTFVPDTVQHLAEGVKFLHELGINQFIIATAEGGIHWDKEGLAEYENQMLLIAHYLRQQKEMKNPLRVTLFEKNETVANKHKNTWGCRAGNTSITVSPSGKIFPCSKMLGQNNLKGIYQIGTVQKGITYLERRKRLTNFIPPKRKKCEACNIKDGCAGGCYAVNYEATGSIYDPCPIQCNIHRKTIEIQKKGLEILGEYA
jgi:uncharacterized protein